MPDPQKPPLKPTMMVAPVRVPKPKMTKNKGEPRPSLVTITTPTTIVGTAPERITVSASELRKLSPAVSAGVVTKTIKQLATVTLAKFNERHAVLWGHDIQEAYAKRVGETLQQSQSPIFRKAEGYLRRMTDILKSIDIIPATGNGKSSMFSGMNARVDTPDELKVARKELEQLTRLMGEAMKELLNLKDRLASHGQDTDALAEDVEAAALAALYLSERLGPKQAGVAQRMTDRAMSLTQTLAQIRSGSAIRDLQIEHPIRMVTAMQHATLVAMPDLLASLTVATQGTKLSLTSAQDLKHKLDEVLFTMTK